MPSGAAWFAAGAIAGAALVWGLSGDGGASDLQQQLDAARVALAMEVQQAATHDAARVQDRLTIDSLTALVTAQGAQLDSLIGRAPAVDTIEVTVPGEPAVRVPVVRAAYADSLRRACSAFRLTCTEDVARLMRLAAADSVELGRRAGVITDLQTRLDTLPVVRPPSRWSVGVCGGYGVVTSAGRVYAGPGAAVGGSYSFFR